MEPLILVVMEWFTVVFSVLVVISGLPVCVNMYRSRSTAGVPYLLFLAYAFLSTLCLQYGILTKNTALQLVNAFALLVWVAYCSVYFLVTKSKTDAFVKASAVFFLYWAHLQYLAVITAEEVVPVLGKYIIIWCTILAILPATEIVNIIKTKSTCDMNMLYATTLNALAWIVYGSLLNDVYIWLPSVPAVIVNFIKFAVICMYSTSKREVVVEKPRTKKDTTNGHIATDFHDKVYSVKARTSLRKGIQ